jgi:hypothetical protein
MIALLASAALAAPLWADVTPALGMRGGVTGIAGVTPWAHLDTGLYLSAMTDLYAFAPETITWGLERQANRHLGAALAVGWAAPVGRWELGVYGLAGPELLVIRETKTVPALDEPVEYERRDLDWVGGVLPVARWWPSEQWGLATQVLLPLPLNPSGNPPTERIHIGIGVSWRSAAEEPAVHAGNQ